MASATADRTVTGVTFNAAHRGTWLVFRLGAHFLCASALEVEGIIQRPHAIAKVPLTPDYVLGAFLFRGHSAAAISLRRKFKLPEDEERLSAPFIVGRVGAAFVGFCVDEVCDVMQEQDAEWRPVPSPLADGVFERIGMSNGRMILQTRFAKLRDAKCEFEAIAAGAACEARLCATPSASPAMETAQPGEINRAPASQLAQECATASTSGVVPTTTSGEPMTVSADGRIEPRLPELDLVRPRNATKEASRRFTPARRPPAPSALAAVESVDKGEAKAMSAEGEALVPDERPALVAWTLMRSAAVALLVVGVCATAFYAVLSIPSGKALRKPIPTSDVGVRNGATSTHPPELKAAKQPAAGLASGTIVVTVERSGGGPAGARDAQAPARLSDDGAAMHSSRTSVHTVVRGDTLWQIAKQHVGDPYRYPELARLSHISDPDFIRPGDVVRIEVVERR